MQPKHLQALIDIQANSIARLHEMVLWHKTGRDSSYKQADKVIGCFAADCDERNRLRVLGEFHHSRYTKLTKRIAKLVVLQRALKDALSSGIFYERYIANDCDDDYIIGSNL